MPLLDHRATALRRRSSHMGTQPSVVSSPDVARAGRNPYFFMKFPGIEILPRIQNQPNENTLQRKPNTCALDGAIGPQCDLWFELGMCHQLRGCPLPKWMLLPSSGQPLTLLPFPHAVTAAPGSLPAPHPSPLQNTVPGLTRPLSLVVSFLPSPAYLF